MNTEKLFYNSSVSSLNEHLNTKLNTGLFEKLSNIFQFSIK